MPLFFQNYDTPGPGVPKDEPQKPGIIRYFTVIGRHFWDLGVINFIYFFSSIPAIIAYFFVSAFSLPQDSGWICICLGLMLPAFLGNGPVRTGVCYVLRNYSREKHAFMWSDLRENAKRHFLRSTILFLINIVFVFLVGMDINFYEQVERQGDIAGLISFYVVIFLFLIYIIFNSYFQMLTVTFDMGIMETVRKALALSMGKIVQNVACLIVCLVFAWVLMWVMGTWPITSFLLLLLGYSFIMLLLDMNSFSVIKKYMVKEEKESEEA